MIQLDNKKKIIIGIRIIVIVIAIIFVVLNKKNKAGVQTPNTVPSNTEIQKMPIRIMTDEEKTDKVGISPNQNAEVLNDQNGLYIYRITK